MMMNIEILNTHFLRKKFCEDNSLPIKVYQSPYFEYFLNLIKEDYQIESKLLDFKNALDNFENNIDNLQKEWYRLKDALANDIKILPEYQELEKTVLNFELKNKLPNSNPYKSQNQIYSIVSIDIRSANFNALRYYNPNLVLKCNTWDELLSNYTTLKYFKESKIFRQIACEPLLAKKQAQIQKKMTDDMASYIIPLSGCISANFVSNDELILFMEKQDLNILQNNIQELLNKYEFASFFKAESFDIEIIHEDCYKKTLFNGKISVRNTPAIIFPQIYKKIKGLEINDNDLIFYEGQQKALAKFIKPIF